MPEGECWHPAAAVHCCVQLLLQMQGHGGVTGLKPASLRLQGKLRQTARQEAGKKKRGQQKPRRPKMESGQVLHCNCRCTILCMGVVHVFHAVPQHMRPCAQHASQLHFHVQGRKRLGRGLCCPLQVPAQSRMPKHPVRSAQTLGCSCGLMAVMTANQVLHCSLLHTYNPALGLPAAGPAR